MVGSLADLKKTLYRKVKYRLRKPQPPTIPVPFNGPVLVVGSAPISNKPADFDASFRVITINGSQARTAAWGVSTPDVTLVQFNQIEGTTTNAVHVRRVLTGQKTGRLYVLLWRKEQRQRLIDGLKAFDYQYAELEIVDKYERMALLDKVVGLKSCELNADSKCSNGVNAVLFALYNGATAVIITGINPASGGHSYNQENLARQHVQMDKQVLQTLLRQGYPLYTTDPAVSDSVGIPLWTGIGTIGANADRGEGLRED
jgi:hypothetical protein